MKDWTVERKTAFSLAAVFILLGIANLASAEMIFPLSHWRSFAMLQMALLLSFAALIVVRRTIKVLIKIKAGGESNADQLRFQLSLSSAIYNVSPNGILVVDDDQIVRSYNQRFLDLWQISNDSLCNMPNGLVGIPDQSVLSAVLTRVREPEAFLKRVKELYDNHSLNEQCEIELMNGRTLGRYSTSLWTEDGQYQGRVWFFHDITERKATVQGLQRSEEKFRQLAENIDEVFWTISPTADEILYISPAYEHVWGRTCESLYRNPASWREAIHPDDRSRIMASEWFAKQLHKETRESEYRIVTPDLEVKWIRSRAFPVHDAARQLVRIVGVAEDITERKAYEAKLEATSKALERSEAGYRKLIELCPDAIFVGANKGTVMANKAAIELLGVSSSSDLIGKRLADLVGPEAHDRVAEVVQQLYENEGQLPLQEMQVRRNDGSLVNVEVAWASFRDPNEMSMQAVFRNITQRKQREAKHAQMIRGIEQVAESIVITDLDGSILYVNPAFENITGYTRAEAIGSNTRILKSGHHLPSFYQSMWATLRNGNTWSGDLINKRKNGTLFNEVATISPIKDGNGAIISFVAVKRDVTHEIVLRNRLKQAEKAEALGRLAGGVAHDFNNLLMVIRTYAELLQSHLPAHDSRHENAEQILKAVGKGASLTGQMLAYSRTQVVSPTVLDLNEVIDDTAKMLKRLIGEDIEFELALTKPISAIEADRDQIVQVLMNLCINARDAMPRGGTLKIATENATVEDGCIGIPAYVSRGEYAMLTVIDSGTGVNKEIQNEVFEPFFTTKEIGQGTGLGLATVYGIVKQGGGYVWLDSEPGRGTCFTIYLPKVERAVTRMATARAEAVLGGTETLLVVEDEGALRTGLCQFLRSLGYLVLIAGSGEEALLLAGSSEQVDLLLTDVILPGMNGREVSEELVRKWPKLKVLYMSGYTDDAVLRSGICEQHTAFLQKPFGLSTLAGRIRDTLRPLKAIQSPEDTSSFANQ